MRSGPNGPERIYLVPVLLPEADASGPNRHVIRGKLLEDGTPVPEEFYTFLAFSANIHIHITDLYTNTAFDGFFSYVNFRRIGVLICLVVVMIVTKRTVN